ncbi:MAG TPA: hypothetical protein DCX54_13705 [Flavobacteriales bacterium]|nr:hypothetical protein [Flavobacteriales bacterium]
MNKLIYIAPVIFLMACISGSPPSKSVVNPDNIQSMILNKVPLQIIDVRDSDRFKKGHIYGAVSISRSDLENHSTDIYGMRIEKEDFQSLIQGLGFTDKDSIYLYDAKANSEAARLWWLFKYYGFEKVAIIDGGFLKWRINRFKEEAGDFTRAPKSEFTLAKENNEELLATKEDISNGVYDQIIDARSVEEYSGDVIKNGAMRPGHIPNAVNFDYWNLIKDNEFTLKNAEEIKSLLMEKGISTDKKTVIYCHSGVRSALMTLALRDLLGLKDVANYDGSWVEWSSDEALPAEVSTKQTHN